MPRPTRIIRGGLCYHVINRANGGVAIFDRDAEFDAFIRLMEAASERYPMRLLAYCLMPNHFHFVAWPQADGDLSRWMRWLMTTHVRRRHAVKGTQGHIWQGRFKSFPIEADAHLLTVLRYVERNPVRAELVAECGDWKWSSAGTRGTGSPLLAEGPVPLPDGWRAWCNDPQTASELERLRRSVNRGAPYGAESWVERAASTLGIRSTLRPRGRPTKGTV